MFCLSFDYEEAGSAFRRSKDEREKALHELFRANREINPRVGKRSFDMSCLIDATSDVHKLDTLVVPLLRLNSSHDLRCEILPLRDHEKTCTHSSG
jgi:hypothetical protein